jgi:endoglucanase
VVDQFGYPPSAEKIAVLRSPMVGFDAKARFDPGPSCALVEAATHRVVLEAEPVPWRGGATDPSSGDRAWRFDFSSVRTPGTYYVVDSRSGVRSPPIRIGESVYRDVLTQAMRMFYYQRDGIGKDASYAGARWADGLAHPQDASCGAYPDGSSPRDLRGGRFDAGDQNAYTNFTASNVVELLRAYSQWPAAFGDASGIPESGNGIPDVVDEAKWDLDWLERMQGADGGVLSVRAHAGARPPSADAAPCRYGVATAAASLSAAWAFATGAEILAGVPAAGAAYPGYAAVLASRAERAWAWAVANPAARFYNAGRLAGGEQEPDEAKRAQIAAAAAEALFEVTGKASYKEAFDAEYASLLRPVDAFHATAVETALAYARAPGASPAIAAAIAATVRRDIGATAMDAARSDSDPYFAWVPAYTWGSNQVKADQGNLLADLADLAADAPSRNEALRCAERYLHYLHGVNPLQLVYLTAMGAYGAQRSVTRLFHTWLGMQPPPGFLAGGPNPAYHRDPCCPLRCGWASLRCGLATLAPPAGQPDQKSYRDFGDGWPLDSWSISEPDDAYQAAYVRLLSRFVR